MKRSPFWELKGMVTGPRSARGLLTFTENKGLNPENLLDFSGDISDYDPSTYLFSGQGVLRMNSDGQTISLIGNIVNCKLVDCDGTIQHPDGSQLRGNFDGQPLCGVFTLVHTDDSWERILYDRGEQVKVIQEFVSGSTITYTKYSAAHVPLEAQIESGMSTIIGPIDSKKRPHGMCLETFKNGNWISGEWENGTLVRKLEEQQGNTHFSYVTGDEKTGYFGQRDTHLRVNPKGLRLETTDKLTTSLVEDGQKTRGNTKEVTTKQPNGNFLTALYDDGGNLVKKIKQKIGQDTFTFQYGSEKLGTYVGTARGADYAYEGELTSNCLFNGKGLLTKADGTTLSGRFAEGQPDGQIIATLPNGNTVVKQFKKGLQQSSVDVSGPADVQQGAKPEPFTGIKTTTYSYGAATELWNTGKVERMTQLVSGDQKWTFSKYNSKTKMYYGVKEWGQGKYEGGFDNIG